MEYSLARAFSFTCLQHGHMLENLQVPNLGLPTTPHLKRSLVLICTCWTKILNIFCHINHFSPILIAQTFEMYHTPCHVCVSPIYHFNNPFLLGYIQCNQLPFNAMSFIILHELFWTKIITFITPWSFYHNPHLFLHHSCPFFQDAKSLIFRVQKKTQHLLEKS